jgi:hypothetical protein
VSVPDQTWIDPWELLACDMSVWDEEPVTVLEMALQTFACLSFDDKNDDEDRSTPRSSMRTTFGGGAGPLFAKLFAAATRYVHTHTYVCEECKEGTNCSVLSLHHIDSRHSTLTITQ